MSTSAPVPGTTTRPDPAEAATDALGASTGDRRAVDSPAIATTRALAASYRRRRCLHEADALDGTLAEYDRIAEEHGCAIREIRALRDLEDVAYGMLGRVPETLDEALVRIADALGDLSKARKTLGGAA